MIDTVHVLHCGIPKVEQWLDGSDRTTLLTQKWNLLGL